MKARRSRHWHIDYLMFRGRPPVLLLVPAEERIACSLAAFLKDRVVSIPRFWSSDCRCESRLFFSAREAVLWEAAEDACTILWGRFPH